MYPNNPFNVIESANKKNLSDSLSIMSHLKKYSYSRPNRYYIEFTLNDQLLEYMSNRDTSLFKSPHDNNSERFNIIKLNCNSVSIPGRNFNTVPLKNSGHNILTASAYGFQPLTLSFNCFSDMKEKVIFEYWMDYIYDPYKRAYSFFDEYKTDEFKIVQMDVKNKPTYAIKLLEVFPTNIQSVMLTYDPSNIPTRLDVTLQYSFLETYNYTNGVTKDPYLANSDQDRYDKMAKDFGLEITLI